ncbi:MAG: LamG domain-containing protein [Planctomycetota bacterium]
MRVVLSLSLLGVAFAAVPCAAQTAFLDKLSAAPGETVGVHVSSARAFNLSVWRSRYFDDNERMLEAGGFPAVRQPAPKGSHAEVASSPGLAITGDLTLEAWIRPVVSSTGFFHGILSKYSIPGDTAYMIYLIPNGRLAFYLGDDGVFNENNRTLTTRAIPAGRYTHVVATYDGTDKRIYLDGELDVVEPRTGPIYDTTEPVRVGAYGVDGSASQYYNGQVDSPAIYSRALSPAEVRQRYLDRADYSPTQPGVLPGAVAQWNFGELDGATLADATGNGHDLTLVNYGTRGVAGPSARTGALESHAIRFSQEDLFNPPWRATHTFTVPPSWESGFYYVDVGGRRLPLIIKPSPGQERRIAVLAATNTWHAYNAWSGNSLYTTHPGGPIAYYVGMRQPNPGVHLDQHTPGSGISHLVDAERYLYKWLDDNGYPFDLYSDLDLHLDASLLDAYDVLILNGHSEYWSHEMIDHVEAFQAAGGSVVNLSGNTMWTVITYDATLSVMEGRKHPHGSGTIPASERWHSQDGGILGGTLRCVGRPEHEVIGTGYGIGGGQARGWALVERPSHWIFAGTGVSAGTPFGEAGLNGGSMMGYEIDVVDPQWTPANTEIIARGAYPTPTFQLGITNCQTRTSWTTTSGGEVIYFDHPGGGGVFGIPSVTVGGTLVVDAIASQMVRNVLDRFLIPQAACAFRNGSGINPIGFACINAPILGASWMTSIPTTPATVATALGLAATPGAAPLFGGELLLGPVPPPALLPGLGTHAVPVPNDPTLLGGFVTAQGFRVDGPIPGASFVLLNAQDLTLGR